MFTFCDSSMNLFWNILHLEDKVVVVKLPTV